MAPFRVPKKRGPFTVSLPRPVERPVGRVHERDLEPEHAALWRARARAVEHNHVRFLSGVR
jgi:hypothetical protein